jgi:hypothetical protein
MTPQNPLAIRQFPLRTQSLKLIDSADDFHSSYPAPRPKTAGKIAGRGLLISP